nr:MAG TPA: hypothetical protein [Crassvirales sp.]
MSCVKTYLKFCWSFSTPSSCLFYMSRKIKLVENLISTSFNSLDAH